ncbi:hypothetical protein ACRAWF_02085 [Streptomyces sp. L7]
MEETADTIVERFPGRAGTAPSCRSASTPTGVRTRTWGWQQDPGGRRPQPEDRLEPDPHQVPARQARVRHDRRADRRDHAGGGQWTGCAAAGWTWSSGSPTPDSGIHRMVWHDRKAWWQQEQAILAYLILAGTTGDPEQLRLAREAAAFYNAFFLDYQDGGVYFNVLANGIPYLLGTERLKGQPCDGRLPRAGAVLPVGRLHRAAAQRRPGHPALQAPPGGPAGQGCCGWHRTCCRPALWS